VTRCPGPACQNRGALSWRGRAAHSFLRLRPHFWPVGVGSEHAVSCTRTVPAAQNWSAPQVLHARRSCQCCCRLCGAINRLAARQITGAWSGATAVEDTAAQASRTEARSAVAQCQRCQFPSPRTSRATCHYRLTRAAVVLRRPACRWRDLVLACTQLHLRLPWAAQVRYSALVSSSAAACSRARCAGIYPGRQQGRAADDLRREHRCSPRQVSCFCATCLFITAACA